MLTNKCQDKLNLRTNLLLRSLALLVFFFISIQSVSAYSFPFREFNKGEIVPDTVFTATSDTAEISLAGLKGKPFVAVFWGADLPAKQKRSAKTLQEVEKLLPFLNERDIKVLSVNIQGDDFDTITAVISESESTVPVYLDPTKEAYKKLGVFVMPAVLLVDQNGVVAAGMGYSRDIVERLKGAVEVMLGEKTEEQVEAELHPEIVEKSLEETSAGRHLNYGLVMMKRGLIDTAIREFQNALELKPDLARAYIELGCLYFERNEIDEAEKSLLTGLEINPESLKGAICLAKIMAQKGSQEDAIKTLSTILDSDPANTTARYWRARVYQDNKQIEKAMADFKLSFELLQKKIRQGPEKN